MNETWYKETVRQDLEEDPGCYVASHPLCELCLKNGRYVVAEEVHHKKPLAEGGTHDWNNLIALCKACHARIHAKRGDRWHKKVEF